MNFPNSNIDSLLELTGNIRYDFDNDVAQLNTGNSLKIYSASNFVYFEIYPEANIERVFYSLPYAKNTSYETPTLFELLTTGTFVSLLCREKIVTEVTSNYDFFFGRTIFYNRTRLRYEFYLFYSNGKIKPCCIDKNEVIDLLKDKAEIIKTYIKEQKIDIYSKEDLMRLINYYNNLSR